MAAPRAAAADGGGGGGDADAHETSPPPANATADAGTPQQQHQPRRQQEDDDEDDAPLWPRVAALIAASLASAKRRLFASPLALLDPPLAAFLVGGVAVAAGLLNWVRAVSPLRRSSPYQFTVVFSEAHKVGEGTPVRMKGVEIGTVKGVAVRPDAVAVDLEIFSARQVVPLASRIDVNALGLMADAIIDITPPENFLELEAEEQARKRGGAAAGAAGARAPAGPRDARCAQEARIVCDGQRVAGHQGANMNFMMRMWLEHNDRTRTKAEW